MAAVEKLLLGLQKLGLPEIEVKLYLTLLAYGTMTAVQAADRSGILRPRAYDALASLERKGLVARAPVKPVKYTVLSPKESFGRLVLRARDEYSTHINEISKVADELVKDLQPLFDKRAIGSADIAWIVSGVRNIQDELYTMLAKAKEQFFVSYDPEFDVLHKLREFGPAVKRFRTRGAKLISLFDLSAAAVEHVEGRKEIFGSGVRLGKRPFGQMGIYAMGEEQVLIAYRSGPTSTTYDIALSLAKSPLASMIFNIMTQLWSMGVSLRTAKEKLK